MTHRTRPLDRITYITPNLEPYRPSIEIAPSGTSAGGGRDERVPRSVASLDRFRL